MKVVRLLAAGALALAVFAAPSVARAQMKFAVVDVQRAVMETEDGLRAQAQLKKFFDKKQKELDDKQNELAKEKEDIEKQAKVLPQAALQKRMEEWQRKAMELQQVFVDYNKELQKKQGEITQPILGKVLGILRRLAAQEGYDAVLDKQTVPYLRSDLDLTDRVVQLYNGGEGGAAPAGSSKPAAPKK